MLKLEGNLITESELALLYDSIKREWRRVLFVNQRGQAVEVLLVPANPNLNNEWDNVARMVVNMHSTFGVYGNVHGRRGDAFWRYVVRNRHSLIFNEVKNQMARHLSAPTVNHLLYWDILPSVDWDAYIANRSLNGGCSLVLCKKHQR